MKMSHNSTRWSPLTFFLKTWSKAGKYKNITVYMKTRSFLLCGLYHLLLNLGTIGLTSAIMSEKYN